MAAALGHKSWGVITGADAIEAAGDDSALWVAEASGESVLQEPCARRPGCPASPLVLQQDVLLQGCLAYLPVSGL